jgi:mono/diheme cytochrome c family protein
MNLTKAVRHSCFVILSSFVLRHSSFGSLAACFAAALLSAGCHSDMYDQPKHEPLEATSFFDDGRSARPLEPGVIAREEPATIGPRETGRAGNDLVTKLPMDLTEDLLSRGAERFTIYCTPCHGRTGEGDGMIVLRGYRRPPSFHTDRLRGLPIGHIFEVQTQGFGVMPPYRKQIPADDRWAIAAYVRALQLSRHAPADELTSEEQKQLP